MVAAAVPTRCSSQHASYDAAGRVARSVIFAQSRYPHLLCTLRRGRDDLVVNHLQHGSLLVHLEGGTALLAIMFKVPQRPVLLQEELHGEAVQVVGWQLQ